MARNVSNVVSAETAARMGEDDVVQRHIERICHEAGLGVMVQVYEILLDRADAGEDYAVAILTFDAEDVNAHYQRYVLHAIDEMEVVLQ